jgi:leader peptidase (prepilin peptidase)/N-methyltransferase
LALATRAELADILPVCVLRAPAASCELVPVLSWLWQKGRSACCQTPISGRYAAIEALSALLTALIGFHYGISAEAALLAGLVCVLAIISTIDLETGFIPDGANLAVGLLGLGWAYLQQSTPS